MIKMFIIKRGNCLIVEEDAAYREALVTYIGGRHPDFRLFFSPANMLDVVRACHGTQIDLAIIDIDQFNGDVWALLRLMREEWPQTELLLLSENRDSTRLIKAIRIGALDVGSKPPVPDELDVGFERYFWKRESIMEGRAELKTSFPVSSGLMFQPARDVVYLHSSGKDTDLHTADGGVVRLTRSLHWLGRYLSPNPRFVRVGKFYVINQDRLSAIDPRKCLLHFQADEAVQLKISRSAMMQYLPKFQEAGLLG